MEPQPSTSSSSSSNVPQDKPDNNHPAIKNWTKEEKFALVQALKTCGREDYEKIQEFVITKDLEQTKAAVDYFTAIALQHPTFKKQNDPKPKTERKSRAPLTEWSKLLTDNLNYNELTTETATALRMIADLENIPAKELTENIDFRQFYHQLANAMEGKPLTPDAGTTAVLHKCLIETALSSKAFIKPATLKYIINNIDFSEEKINRFPWPTDDHELAILRHLASQRSYNPLNIPEEHLKPSTSNLDAPKPNKKARNT